MIYYFFHWKIYEYILYTYIQDRVNQKKGRSQNIIVFHELLSLGCINFKNLRAHHQEEVLRFPKHPLLAQFDESEAKLWCSKEDRFFLKYFWYSILVATLFFAVFSANTHQKDDFWGCFGNLRISSWWWAQRFWKLMQKWLRKLKLKLATLFWKVTERQKNDFCAESAHFNFNYLSHFWSNCQNLSAHHQEEILRIPKHSQLAKFEWVLAEKTAKNCVTF